VRNLLTVLALFVSLHNSAWASVISPASTSFAYSARHAVLPLSTDVIASLNLSGRTDLDGDTTDFALVDATLHVISWNVICISAAGAARTNSLSVSLFTNLIWQESSFNVKLVSRVGAQGIAQFMPQTAVRYGLLNPFDPLHAMSTAGMLLRDLKKQFGNFGLAAAAYNAGPRRVTEWITKRRVLPKETRNFVLRITGRSIEDWMHAPADEETLLAPSKAPCPQLAPPGMTSVPNGISSSVRVDDI
jgi:hypothetical protein